MIQSKSANTTNNNKLALNLPQLQNLIKRDPLSYVEEFQRHLLIYKCTLDIFNQNPTVFNQDLNDLVFFLAQISKPFYEHLKQFPDELCTILKTHGTVLHPNQRLGLVRALILLRNKDLIPPTDLLVLFFQLLQCPDKVLRKFLEQHIINDISNINKKNKNNQINKKLQNFMHEMLTNNHAVAARTALDIMIKLYEKRVWNDSKTVNIIAEAVFSKIAKLSVAGIKFFVGNDKEDANDSDESDSDDDNVPNLRVTLMAQRVGKKTKKKQRHVDKVKTLVKKNRKKVKTKKCYDFSALHLIHDPQTVAERTFKKLETTNHKFEVKLLMMNFISRLIGVHQLYLSNFYPLVQRFLFPHQQEVTKVMTYAVQAAHSQVPPDELAPTVRTLADNFVTERCNSEAMAMGLNAIRELCNRNPFCMNEDLLGDLSQYRTHRDKGVMMAARGLIAVFREKNPDLLRRKDRGAPTELSKEEENLRPRQYGESKARSHVPGAEIISYTGECEESEESEEEDTDSENEEEMEVEEMESDVKTDENNLTRKEAMKKVLTLTPVERTNIAEEITSSRCLTDADFAKIESAQAAKQVELWASSRKGSKKRKKSSIDEEEVGDSEIVSEKSIVMIYKKRRHDKDARLESVMAGREGREKFGAKTGRMNPHASTTNKEKKKGKSFMMLKHKIRRDQKVSFQTKQIRLRDSLLKQKKKLIK